MKINNLEKFLAKARGGEMSLSFVVGMALAASCMAGSFNGLTADMASLCRLSDARSRSISPENFTGARNAGALADPVADKDKRNVANASGCARELGKGWKVNPFVKIAPGETLTLADIEGPGAIQHIWMTPTKLWRHSIIRMYWDGEASPSVECPVGDFFASAYNKYAQVSSLAVCVNPGSAFNCYWLMPFRRRARVTMENVGKEEMRLYYQIDYTLTDIPSDAAYRHGLVGRGRDQVPPRRRGEPHHLRHGHGGLLLRFVQLRDRRAREVPRVHHALHGARAGHQAGRPEELHLLRPLPLARDGSRPFREGAEGDYPGPRVEGARTLQRAGVRHCLHDVLVPDGAARAVPGAPLCGRARQPAVKCERRRGITCRRSK